MNVAQTSTEARHASKTGSSKESGLDMKGFIGLLKVDKNDDAIRLGEKSEIQQVRHSAGILKRGGWKHPLTGEYIPAVPGFGPITMYELERVVDLMGEGFAYDWVCNTWPVNGHKLSWVKGAWDRGELRIFDGPRLTPQVTIEPQKTVKTKPSPALAAAKRKKEERAAKDREFRNKTRGGGGGDSKKGKNKKK